MQTNPKVDFFFNKPTQWQAEYKLLREIALSTGLTEELKWGCPCYSLDGKNVVLIHGFKEYCALLFMKGALMKDPKNILIQQTENVQSARQIRFTSATEIKKLTAALKGYIKDAIQIEKSGQKVELKKASEYPVPEEFQKRLDKDVHLKKAFHALTPGRQRGYLYHFGQPKLSKTREARVEKYIPHILDGKGIDD
jgi:uncharacterized protein YdeI (YjbR/CyaY-like superfamily)